MTRIEELLTLIALLLYKEQYGSGPHNGVINRLYRSIMGLDPGQPEDNNSGGQQLGVTQEIQSSSNNEGDSETEGDFEDVAQ